MKPSDNDLPLFTAATRPRLWAVEGAELETPRPPQEAPPAPTAGLELFQSNASGGYERWKAEAQAERRAQEEKRLAEELPTAGDHQGYEAWRAEIAEARRAFEHRWGIPLGKAVRLRLRGEAVEREGVLRVAEGDLPQKGRSLTLRLGDLTFAAGQIECVVRLD